MEKQKINYTNYGRNFVTMISEAMVVLVPLGIIYLLQNSMYDFTIESLFAASILFGQTLLKLIKGLAGYHGNISKERITLLATILFVFGLIPSLLFLNNSLIGNEFYAQSNIPSILLLSSLIVFLIIGSFAELLQDPENKLDK